MREYIRLSQKISERKLRLFALACSRHFWHLLFDERSRKAIEFTHQFVELRGTNQERAAAAEKAWAVVNAAKSGNRTGAEIAAAEAAAKIVDSDWPLFARWYGSSGIGGQQYAWRAVNDSVFFTNNDDQRLLWLDLVGNPFRPVRVARAWLTWNDRTVSRIAEGIYAERAFERMPILHDALLDAGCADEALLMHCRNPEGHVRGCWALDLILGKE
jgi:hypothetical protein